MRSPKNLNQIYRNYLALRWVGGDLTNDEKRVQNELCDKRIKVRWHRLAHNVQVWYEAASGPYCVFVIEANYSPAKVIYLLRERQKKARELRNMYLAGVEAKEKVSRDKIRDVADEMARQTRKIARGRVAVSS